MLKKSSGNAATNPKIFPLVLLIMFEQRRVSCARDWQHPLSGGCQAQTRPRLLFGDLRTDLLSRLIISESNEIVWLPYHSMPLRSTSAAAKKASIVSTLA